MPAPAPTSYQTLSSFQARQELLAQFGDHQMVHANPENFLFRETSTQLNALTILKLEFVGDVAIRHYTTRDLFLLHIPLSGYFLHQTSQGQTRIDPHRAFMLSPDNKPHFRMPEGCECLILKLKVEALEQYAQQLLQYRPQQTLSFPLAGFSTQAVEHLEKTCELIVQQYAQLTDDELKSLWVQQSEKLLLTALLTQFDNNYRTLLQRHTSALLPQALRQARNHMLEHISEPICLRDLGRAAEISERSLSYLFKKHTNSTPMNYLLDLRLDKLRDALESASPGDNITDIALHFGFNHAGRMASHYRQRFGELPSHTQMR